MAGLPANFKGVQTLLGLEYRPTFWINIYNRIRYLDFDVSSTNSTTKFDFGFKFKEPNRKTSILSEWLESIQDNECSEDENYVI